MASKLKFSIMPFQEWRREISPLWLMEGNHKAIPQILNGHGQMQFVGQEFFSRILLFPIATEYEGERVAWTSIYNISDSALRVRGIYVQPEFRSNGIGRAMVNYAIGLWPSAWRTCYMYSRASNVERYKRWGFDVVPSFSLRSFDDKTIPGEAGIVLVRKFLQAAEPDDP
jgi:GNAT superfamily N-acetyltransferase